MKQLISKHSPDWAQKLCRTVGSQGDAEQKIADYLHEAAQNDASLQALWDEDFTKRFAAIMYRSFADAE